LTLTRHYAFHTGGVPTLLVKRMDITPTAVLAMTEWMIPIQFIML
jgi:hypothetical protein